MKRRSFLKKLPIAASIPFTIAGIPMRVMADNPLTQVLKTLDTDKVLIILQMHGGNDGLNSLIPVENYEGYYKARPNIAIPAKNSIRSYIPLDSTLPANAQVGLHPDMSAMKAMYDRAMVNIVQGVSYKNNNGSHFRGRDIWFMGGGFDDYFDSGWLGRYLENEYAYVGKYPEDFIKDGSPMPDPLALEMGSDSSLLFHQHNNIPASIYIENPKAFYDEVVNGLEGFQDVDERGIPPDALKESAYWKELNNWILEIESSSKKYAQRLGDLLRNSQNPTVTYPEKYPFNAPVGSAMNPLSDQLRLIAQLLQAGVKTRVFMVKIGGFDTHAGQVESYDPTMGAHAALMYHISTAMKAFQDDLKSRGLDERVLTVSTSEFGRRIKSNGSFGTDHGTGGPIYIFGRGAIPGVTGVVPDLTKDNVEMQYDYRQVYASIMLNWMGVDKTTLSTTIFGDQINTPQNPAPRNFIDGQNVDDPLKTYEPMSLATQDITTGVDEFIGARFSLDDCFPNPAREKTIMVFRVNAGTQVTINLIDDMGRQVKKLINKPFEPGKHQVEVDLNGIPAGHYIYQMKALFYNQSKKLEILK
jgi:uncharacterized protein (DUF1501 family)